MRKFLIAAAAVAAAASTPAFAQAQGGLVNVSIGDVTILDNFLNGSQVAALNNISVPVTVQVPIGVAANVCGVDANVLAHQAQMGAANCDATNGSRALAQEVNRQLLGQSL